MTTAPPGIATLRLVLGDQLSDPLSALDGIDPARDVVLMAEVRAECTYVRHHKKKLVLVLSGMRHFAERLRQRGICVDYIELENPANTHTLRGEMLRAVERHSPERVVATLAGEFRLTEDMSGWEQASGTPTELL
ncbi:MAG: cryptochrome/photolyase family protein, partial [Janthinobacterium lividum]